MELPLLLATPANKIALVACGTSFFFAVAIASYIIHGATRDTDNAFRPPYHFGKLELSPLALHLATGLLILESRRFSGVVCRPFAGVGRGRIESD